MPVPLSSRCALQQEFERSITQVVTSAQVDIRWGLGCGLVTCGTLLSAGLDGLATSAEFVALGPAVEQAQKASTVADAGEIACTRAAWTQLRDLSLGFGGVEAGDVVRRVSWPCEPLPKRLPTTLRPETSLDGFDLRTLSLFVPRFLDRAQRSRYSYASYDEHAKLSELREMTVCSLCIAGPSSLEALDPALGCVHRVADILGGTVLKVRCDCEGLRVMVCFSLPGALYEGGPQRAVAFVFLLRNSLQILRAGVATGIAFCGVVGSRLRVDYVVVGEAVDAAHRLEAACTRVPHHVFDHVRVLVCALTERRVRDEVICEDLRLDYGKKAYVPMTWRQRVSTFIFDANESPASHKETFRRLASIFERQSRGVCAIDGGHSAVAARSFAERSIPSLARLHNLTLLRSLPAMSAYDDAALALDTVCGAWRGHIIAALDVFDGDRSRRRSFHGIRWTKKPRPSDEASQLSPRRRTSLFSFFSSSSSSPRRSARSPVSPPNARGARLAGSQSSSTPRRRQLNQLLSGNRSTASDTDTMDLDAIVSLKGRTQTVLALLPARLHCYAGVLNDAFLPDERNRSLKDGMLGATRAMRRARLVQLVVLLLLGAAKRQPLAILVETLEHMDDASWDVLYKLAQWHKKTITKNSTKPSRFVLKKARKAASVDLGPFAADVASDHALHVVVVAPYSTATGASRAEWLETRRMARAAGTYLDLSPFDLKEARLFAAEKLRLCSINSCDEVKARASDVVAGALDDLVASALGEPDVLAALLADARDAGRITVRSSRTSHGGSPAVQLRVDPDLLDTLEPPTVYAASVHARLDTLTAFKHNVLLAASLFGREFTPTLLALALDGDVATACATLCAPHDATDRIFLVRPRLLDESTDDPDSRVFAFAEPLTQRTIAASLTEPQVDAVFNRIRSLEDDAKHHVLALVSPYVTRKFEHLLPATARCSAAKLVDHPRTPLLPPRRRDDLRPPVCV